jgi:hypothetical protein
MTENEKALVILFGLTFLAKLNKKKENATGILIRDAQIQIKIANQSKKTENRKK